jgi:hypothetical protein
MEISPSPQTQLMMQFASHMMQLIAWPTVVIGAWKLRGWLSETEDAFAAKIDKITENHLHHIQESMKETADALRDVAAELRELRQDIRLK